MRSKFFTAPKQFHIGVDQEWHDAGNLKVIRRIDIKIYPARNRVCAINYFTGSAMFQRALRYWCIRPPPHVQALAAKCLSHATHFKLSDRDLAVQLASSTDTHVTYTLWCESDLFRAVGLSYVPPHLRHFMNYNWAHHVSTCATIVPFIWKSATFFVWTCHAYLQTFL